MSAESTEPRLYQVSRRDRAPLVDFVSSALKSCGCRLLHVADAGQAPFRFTFETAEGERIGIMAYAFFANSRVTKNRPGDEHRFQLKYGTKDGAEHPLWQDPYSLYTALLIGIDTERGILIGADPSLARSVPSEMLIRYGDTEVQSILELGWHVWERDRGEETEDAVDVLVGVVSHNFLRYLQFEMAARFEEAGERFLIAEQFSPATSGPLRPLIADQKNSFERQP